MDYKKCCGCGRDKQLDEFGPRKDTKDGKQFRCICCNREQAKLHYVANKEKHVKRAFNRKSRIREILSKIKAEIGCYFCSENCGLCLDFHHADSSSKELEISCVHVGIDRLLNEIKKCEVVCANCHRKIHGGLLKLGPRRDIDVSCLKKMARKHCGDVLNS